MQLRRPFLTWRKAGVVTLGFFYVVASLFGVFDFSVQKAHAVDIWYPGGWIYRQKITFDNSAQAENLAQFPVMIKKTAADTDFWANVLASCADVRFSDSNGFTSLAYEIEQCDSGSGDMIAWVNVPQINASSNTDHIYMYYGNAGASSAENSNAVWNSGYVGVWHLHDGNDATINDSSGNNQDGTATGVTATGGAIDGAVTIASGDYIDTGTGAYGKPSVFTLSGWIKPSNWDDAGIFFSSDTAGGVPDTHWGFFGRDGGNIEIFTSVHGGEYTETITEDGWNSGVFSSGTWNQITMTVNGEELRYFKNGVQVGPVYDTITNSGTAFPLYFGVNPADSFLYTYEGDMDEVQLSTVSRSPAWVKASYLSESDTFNTFGGQEEAVPGVLNNFVFDTVSAQAAGAEFSVTLSAVDAYGDPVAFTGTVDFSALNGSVIPSTSDNFIAGVLTQNITLTGAGDNRTISVAETSGNALGVSNEFAVSSGELDHLAIATIGAQTAGGTFAVTITGKDAYENTVTDFVGPINLTTTAGTITPDEISTVTSPGVISEMVTVTQSGAGKTITASANGGAVLSTSDSFSVAAGTVNNFVIDAISYQHEGFPFEITVTAKDEYNNTVTDFNGTVEITTPDTTFTSDAFSGGVLSGQSVTIATVGSGASISVVEPDTSTNGTSDAFTVYAATTIYYFDNAVNTSPSTLGNFWIDSDYTIHAPELPGSGDEINIQAGATYNGSIVFNGNAINEGTVNGDAEFNDQSVNKYHVTGGAVFNDDSYNDTTAVLEQNGDFYDNAYSTGTISDTGAFHGNLTEYVTGSVGSKVRYYGVSIAPVRDFVSDGPWTIVADGAGVVVDLADAEIDENTTLEELNGGSFINTGLPSTFVFASISDYYSGVPFTVTITAKDWSGATLTGYAGTVSFSTNVGSITPEESTASFVNGVLSQSVTITGVFGGITITADDGSGTVGESGSFNLFAQATSYTLVGPTSGNTGSASTAFTVAPNSYYNGTITITPSGGGLSTPIILTFSSETPQTFTITPATAGEVTLTPTNSGGLTNPALVAYTANAASQQTTLPPPAAVGLMFIGGASTAPSSMEQFERAENQYLFRSNLRFGQSSVGVLELQKYLNKNGFFVSKNGAGSLGKETSFFGVSTRSALKKFQEAHRLEILTPLGLTNGTGILGPSTIRYINGR